MHSKHQRRSPVSVMDSPKYFGPLLQAVLRSLFENAEITAETLKQEIYADVSNASLDDISNLFELCKGIIARGAREDLEVTHFEAFVQKEKALSSAQQDLFVKVWKSQKAKIHDYVYRKVRWNNSLQKISWRIDVKTKTKALTEVNEPTAIVEMNIGKTNKEQDQQLVRFELDKEQLDQLLLQINNIQHQLTSSS